MLDAGSCLIRHGYDAVFRVTRRHDSALFSPA